MGDQVLLDIDHLNEMTHMIGVQQKTIDLERESKEQMQIIIDKQAEIIAVQDQATANVKRITEQLVNEYKQMLRNAGVDVV